MPVTRKTSVPMKSARALALFDHSQDVDLLIDIAKRHGTDSDPDHEVGDLQDLFRVAFSLLSPAQQAKFTRDPVVRVTLQGGLVDLIDSVDQIDQDEWPKALEWYGLDASYRYTAGQQVEIFNQYLLAQGAQEE